MTTFLGFLLSLLSAGLIGAAGFIFSISNRVTKVETKQEDLPTLINTKFEEVNRRLGRIERGMNGHLREED